MIRYVVTINSYENRNDVIYYTIRVDGSNFHKILYKRYSDLKVLKEQLY